MQLIFKLFSDVLISVGWCNIAVVFFCAFGVLWMICIWYCLGLCFVGFVDFCVFVFCNLVLCRKGFLCTLVVSLCLCVLVFRWILHLV